MASGFRWGRRPMVPRSAEPFVEEVDDEGFPTDWARTRAGTAARQVLLNGVMGPMTRSQVAMRVYGVDALAGIEGPLIFFSNHASHLDATLIMCSLPERWQKETAVGAARDYFFDVWWRQAFIALVYGGFAIDRAKGGTGAIDKARDLLLDGWSLVVFPEGTRSPGRAHAAVPPRGVAPRDRDAGWAWRRSRSWVRSRRCRRAGSGRVPDGRR